MQVFKNDWNEYLQSEIKEAYYIRLREFLIQEYRTRKIYPGMYDIFNALHYTGYQQAKVVILGQDPYHGPGQAMGLSFSVPDGVALPPSLRNIYKELHDE